MRALRWPAAVLAAALGIQPAAADERARLHLQVQAPSYGPAPQGYLYGGPLPPPYPYYAPYPYYGYVPQPPAPQPPQHSEIGHLIIVVEPVGAQVSLDGVRLAQRPDLSYAVGVLEGPHRLRVSADGFEPHERPLDVRGGVGSILTIRLQPLARQR